MYKRVKDIYVYGVDLPFLQRNYKSYKEFRKFNLKKFAKLLKSFLLSQESPFGGVYKEELIKDFRNLLMIAKENKIKIHVMSESSNLKLIQDSI